MRDKVILRIEHAAGVYRATRTFGWFGAPRYLYPAHALSALVEVFPWEACLLAVLATFIIGFVGGAQEAGALGVCIALALVTVQMFRTRAFLTESSLVKRTGLLFTRRSVTLPFASIAEIRVEDSSLPEGFADLVVTAGEQIYRFHAVARAQEVAAAIRARASMSPQ